jgi:hypothetical protein
MAESISEIFKKDMTLSTLFVSFYSPKTQSEAAEWIYNKNSSLVNQKPIIRARERLDELRFLELNQSLKNLKRIELISKVDPVVEYIKQCFENRKKTSKRPWLYELKDEDMHFLRLFLNSDWFRKNCFNRKFVEEEFHRFGILPINKEYPSNKITIFDGLKYIFYTFFHITTITYGVGIVLGDSFPESKDFLKFNKFEDFMENWSEKMDKIISQKKMNHVIENIYPENESEQEFNKLTLTKPYPALCIPLNIAILLCYVIRLTSGIDEIVGATRKVFRDMNSKKFSESDKELFTQGSNIR